MRACEANGVVLDLIRRRRRCVLCGRTDIALALRQQTDEQIVTQPHLRFHLTPHEKLAHCVWSETFIEFVKLKETQNSKSPTSSGKLCIWNTVAGCVLEYKLCIPRQPKKNPPLPTAAVDFFFQQDTTPRKSQGGLGAFFQLLLLATSSS